MTLGFFLSGLIHEFIPTSWVEKTLGKKGPRSIFYATVTGSILPICCWGALAVAVSFYKKGSRLGPILAFLLDKIKIYCILYYVDRLTNIKLTEVKCGFQQDATMPVGRF